MSSKQTTAATRRLLIITKWGYPFGGGEAFMRDSIDWCSDMFTEILWLSFMCFNQAESRHMPWPSYDVQVISDHPGIAFVNVPTEMTSGALEWWIHTLDPDVVHHQGSERIIVCEACAKLKVPVLTGFHFWHGAVQLSSTHNNANIMEHISEHSIDPEFYKLLATSGTTVYWASQFMKDVVAAVASDDRGLADRVKSMPIIAPVSNESKVVCTHDFVNHTSFSRTYVTQINIHPGKGGSVIRYCIKNTPSHVRYQCVITEPTEPPESTDNHRVLVLSRVEDVACLYARTKVLLVPSIVDETFCRVALEGLMNGLPIIASPAGYLRTMLAQCDGAILMPTTTTPPSQWRSVLMSIVDNEDKLAAMSAASADYYRKILLPMYNSPFVLRSLLSKLPSCRTNVMIFAPYADQGLGVQARNYVRILEQLTSAKTAIFSYKPYYAGRHQQNPAEWEHPRCYYSDNIRENVTNEEIAAFVDKYEIGTAVIPETCWFRVFEIADYLRSELHVRTYAVPNVEILRTDEFEKHVSCFDGLLCNNRICQQVLSEHSEYLKSLTNYIGYAIAPTRSPPPQTTQSQSVLRFLCLGGMNAFSRKQIDVVCAAFRMMPPGSVQLTVTNQNECEIAAMNDLMRSCANMPHIKFIWKALSYSEIESLYINNCDVVIQVSKHEGLGIGFFEALNYGKPVVTLDVPPHNEIIRPKINGWLVPTVEMRQSTENPMSPMKSAFFKPEDLLKILQNEVLRDDIAHLKQELAADYATRFSVHRFSQRFAAAIRVQSASS